MDLNIEDLNKVISTLVSNDCSDQSTEQCLKKLILYTSENDILLSHLSSILISAKNQVNFLFKSLTALHYTINYGDQKFLHYLASNNLNFVNLEKHKHKFSDVNVDYLTFLKRYVKYLQQKISVYKFINMESSWLTKLTQKTPKCQQVSSSNTLKNDESVLQHDIIGEQLMRKISYIENQIDYLVTEFNGDNLNLLITILDNNNLNTKRKLVELVCSLLMDDVISYANYYQDIMSELIEQFDLMNRKHCKDAIEVYRKLPDKIENLRKFLLNCNQQLMETNAFQTIDISKLVSPSIELQEKMEQHWKILESKPKRKNSERRKEKSKYAARLRRGEESDLLNELSELVPLPDIKLLDKASIMRLSIAYINTKQFAQNYFQLSSPEKQQEDKTDQFDGSDYLDVLKTSNLILTLLSLEGDLVFISPNVINLIGLKQNEMLGMSIFDFVHPCDHDELRNALKKISEDCSIQVNSKDDSSMKSPLVSQTNEIEQLNSNNNTCLFKDTKHVSFMVRIKCTLNNKSKCVPLKSANYKMASFSGYLKESTTRPLLVLSVDILLSPSAQLKLKCAGSSVFVTKHTPDLKFINIDDKLTSLFGYDEKDLIGCSLFQYIHASDAFQLFNSFQKLLSRGEVETRYYRFLNKTGGYFWIQTKASLLTDYNTQKPQTILCVHYLISELISAGVILSNTQSVSTASDNTLKSVENTNSVRKGQRLTKKAKSTVNKQQIVKANPSSKVIKKPTKMTISKKLSDDLIENEQLTHFVQDCKEFDEVMEKLTFKQQFKKEYEAQLNNRMSKQIIEPVFNTFSVFSPLKEDQYDQVEPSSDNSPLIATPLSITQARKVDMPCIEMNSFDCLSDSSNSEQMFDLTKTFTTSTASYIPESVHIDELKTTIGNTTSIFTPLTDNNCNYMMASADDLTAIKKIDEHGADRWLSLAPQAGDAECCIDTVDLDFDDLPMGMDTDLIKEINSVSSNNVSTNSYDSSSYDSVSMNSNSLDGHHHSIKPGRVQNLTNNLNNSTISFNDSNDLIENGSFDFLSSSSSKSVKVPNHFNNLELEITKKARFSFDQSSANIIPPHQSIKITNSKLNSNSALLNLLLM